MRLKLSCPTIILNRIMLPKIPSFGYSGFCCQNLSCTAVVWLIRIMLSKFKLHNHRLVRIMLQKLGSTIVWFIRIMPPKLKNYINYSFSNSDFAAEIRLLNHNLANPDFAAKIRLPNHHLAKQDYAAKDKLPNHHLAIPDCAADIMLQNHRCANPD